MPLSKRSVFLTGILLLAIFLRFYHFTVTPPGLYADEAMDGNNALQAAHTHHFQVFYTEDQGREGLYINLLAAFYEFHPTHQPWTIRLPAAIAGVLTVLGMCCLIAELFSENAGLLAAFLLAASTWHITFSRLAFRAILAPLLLVWALYLLLKAFRTAALPRPYVYAFLAGIIYGLGFYTYIAYRITPLLFLLLIPFFRKTPRFWKLSAVFTIVIFLTAAPLGWYFLHHPADFFGRIVKISITTEQHPLRFFLRNTKQELLMLNVRGDSNWRHNVSRSPELFWPVGVLFWTGVVLGLRDLYRRWKAGRELPSADSALPAFPLLLMYTWFVLAILPASASNDNVPHALRSILMLPPIMAFAAIGGQWLYRVLRARWPAAAVQALAAAFVVAVGTYGYIHYFISYVRQPGLDTAFNMDYVKAGNQLNALPADAEKYVEVGLNSIFFVQTTRFITDSYTDQEAASRHMDYILPGDPTVIPPGTPQSQIVHLP